LRKADCARRHGSYHGGMDARPEPATPADAAAIASIYAHHVAHGTGSYDVEPRSVETTAVMIADHVAKGWPFLVARGADGAVRGYAYASQFRVRPAYAWACEDSIYVHPDWQGQGVGKRLLDALIDAATAAGFRTMVGVIGGAEPASIALHAACGFDHVGRLVGMGWKHGAWRDNVYMQRALGEGTATPPAERGQA
jgi:phosphinothricin acetyltransferase